MTREGLIRRLEKEGVVPGSYDLDGTQKDEVYCFERRANGWAYYYRERGLHRDEQVFTLREEATHHFLDRVLGDPTTRLPR